MNQITTTGYILFSSTGSYEERQFISIAHSDSKLQLEEVIRGFKRSQEIINRYIDLFNSSLGSFNQKWITPYLEKELEEILFDENSKKEYVRIKDVNHRTRIRNLTFKKEETASFLANWIKMYPLEESLKDFVSFEDGTITSKIKWNEYFICEMNNVVKP